MISKPFCVLTLVLTLAIMGITMTREPLIAVPLLLVQGCVAALQVFLLTR